MSKKEMSLVAATFSLTTAFGAWAACGDFECGWVGDTFVCIVESPGGGTDFCTVKNPCHISCP